MPLRVFLRKRCMGRTHAMEEIARGRLKTVRKGSHHVVTPEGAREYDALVEREAEEERAARAARRTAA